MHIIIDRVTSKTKDAFIEFVTMTDAMRAVQRHQATVDRGRTARLGDRPVTVELSSMDMLMAELFPHAWVKWRNGGPVINSEKDQRYEWRNFKGFITEEEMTMLVKHVEQPHRVSDICPPSTRTLAKKALTPDLALDSLQQRLPPAALRVHDLDHQQVALVLRRVYHHEAAQCHAQGHHEAHASPSQRHPAGS